jgi:hypothetical protein
MQLALSQELETEIKSVCPQIEVKINIKTKININDGKWTDK